MINTHFYLAANSDSTMTVNEKPLLGVKHNLIVVLVCLQVSVLLSEMSYDLVGEAIPLNRLFEAVNVVLSLQVLLQATHVNQ